jgi:hypothetical protein
MTRRARFLLPVAAATLLLTGCDVTDPTAPSTVADDAPRTVGAHAPGTDGPARTDRVRGRALVDLRGTPAADGVGNVTEVRFRGRTRSGRPIAGEGTVVRARYDARKQVYAFTIDFQGALGVGAAARPIEGEGHFVVSPFEADYSTDGNDLFWEDVVLSFDAEYSGDGNDL